MKIRLAKKSDNKDVSNLFKALDIKTYASSDIVRVNKWIAQKECYIAEKDNEIVAAIVLKLECLCYEIICLSSKMKGGGRKLIEFTIERCKKEKVLKIWCWSLKQFNAVGFYKKMGFEERYLMSKQEFGKDYYFFGKLINNK